MEYCLNNHYQHLIFAWWLALRTDNFMVIYTTWYILQCWSVSCLLLLLKMNLIAGILALTSCIVHRPDYFWQVTSNDKERQKAINVQFLLKINQGKTPCKKQAIDQMDLGKIEKRYASVLLVSISQGFVFSDHLLLVCNC